MMKTMLEKMAMTDEKNTTADSLSILAEKRQREASDPQASVWVEASAGTGKTKVLTDRVIRLLLSGVLPSKILCLTYTKAAAVEMKSRIAGKLASWSVADEKKLEEEIVGVCGSLPSDEKLKKAILEHARRLFALFLDTAGGMRIQTIHGFCQDVLKRFPLEAGISPHFEVMDDRKSKEILNNIKKEILENRQEPEIAAAIEYLVENISEYSFPDILQMITESRNVLAEFLHKYKSFSEMKERLAESLELSVDETTESLQQKFMQNTDIEEIRKICAALGKNPKKKDTDAMEIMLSILEKGWSKELFEQYKGIFVGAKNKEKALPVCEDNKKQTPELVDWLSSEQQRVLQYVGREINLRVFLSTTAILTIAEKLISKYDEFKRKSSKNDYEDLVLITKNLLENRDAAQWVLYKLDGGIDHILVDEAQDNSGEQWAIIRSLSEEFFAGFGAAGEKRTVFAVGDRKQSIYGFQGANPGEFENMRQYFSKKSQDFKTVSLDVSFRSTPQVLDVVNMVFKSENSKKGVAPENQTVEHLAHRVGQAGRVELWPILEAKEANVDEREEFDLPKAGASQELAGKIAKRIKETVLEKTYIPSRKRFASYGDFLILVQRRGQFVAEFIRECKNRSIPIAGADRIKLLDQIAVQDLLSLGKFLLLPVDDLSLAEVLKSPLFGLDDDDLTTLCAKRGNASLWSKLADFPQYREVYEYLQNLLNMTDFLRPYELYNRILSVDKKRIKFVERLGIEVEDGLNEFLNLTIEFEREHIPSLQEFIRWMEEDDVEIKRETEQSEVDAVRIMTVHGSKGLQAPIVILPDTLRKPPAKRVMDLLVGDELYFPLCSADYADECEKIYQKNQQKAMDEYRRLLYVALTRAEDVLCICGFKKKNQKADDSWYNLCFEAMEKIANPKEEILVYEAKDKNIPDVKDDIKPKKHILPDFEWIKTDAPQEAPLSKPYRPSIDEKDDEICASPIEEKEQYRYKRGLIIHKILQMAGSMPKESRNERILEFIEKNMPEAGENTIRTTANEVISLLEDARFSDIFGGNSSAEVSVMGEVDGKIISAQIDRLYVCGNCVKIVDFKTNRPAADSAKDVPQAYIKQLGAYEKLLQKIYPDKKVEKYILWTNTATMMRID